MSKILALDTSTDACSVALSLNGEITEDFRIIPRQHTQQLLPMIEVMLAEAGISVSALDAIAFGRGPGSFAGIRIATGVAQGLAYGADLPVLPISTLESLAVSAAKREGAEKIVTALDARMDEIYVASYRIENGLPITELKEQVSAPDALSLECDQYLAVGSGWRYLDGMSEQIKNSLKVSTETYYPSARDMLVLALDAWAQDKGMSPEQALPVYLRDEVAWKKKDQQ
ncbi:tRNA (adenosine(37)-N6)-threonylcarbamoyltransferase complex dimerization subunit type 1 TsaB [Neptuniibacter sp. 2_MG-2023]|jgi:tRNA threonylcarbamoyladenosine biosynthesis protein TsaB|uniref:tRNA (adenosine(37)-N6)-threonylcarbamoyltransferase complex dimerization subunit type 1 TsaB n=1 Tax=Neptuniibacter sp. 2_MG-2023 TaxID=3062671 RepID=UPI0026E3DF76|nr:tRNA (adenosine(37)-N6)-threonylcarbamoyltransferase complex dimerization subunit type 1 TsaB [Neptuniibacter sp. 2_MG-2023]MDO6512685.1 tRNA (adenosine(37)-N6)-threonylcarbamoyltransferase complex dimerization subunit type 1 TsaB [Neptuniibacter sp. 2_MG-2023]